MVGTALDLFAWTSLRLASSLVSLRWEGLIEEEGDDAFSGLDTTSLTCGRNILVKARKKSLEEDEVWDCNDVERFLENLQWDAPHQGDANNTVGVGRAQAYSFASSGIPEEKGVFDTDAIGGGGTQDVRDDMSSVRKLVEDNHEMNTEFLRHFIRGLETNQRRLPVTERVLLQAVLAAIKDFSKSGRNVAYLEEGYISAMKIVVLDDLNLHTRLTSGTVIAAIGFARLSERRSPGANPGAEEHLDHLVENIVKHLSPTSTKEVGVWRVAEQSTLRFLLDAISCTIHMLPDKSLLLRLHGDLLLSLGLLCAKEPTLVARYRDVAGIALKTVQDNILSINLDEIAQAVGVDSSSSMRTTGKLLHLLDISKAHGPEAALIVHHMIYDFRALVDLHSATYSANWLRCLNWCTDKPLSAWQGVTMDSSRRVTRLDLWRNNISGYPSEGQVVSGTWR